MKIDSILFETEWRLTPPSVKQKIDLLYPVEDIMEIESTLLRIKWRLITPPSFL